MMESGRKPRKTATRSETVSVRFEPKLRYLAELAARRQRRTLSSYIESVVAESLDHVFIKLGQSIGDMGDALWNVEEADRFVALAFAQENLLTHEEEILWKLIRENGSLWRGSYVDNEWCWNSESKGSLLLPRLREHWNTFKQVARGEASADTLPTWERHDPNEPPF